MIIIYFFFKFLLNPIVLSTIILDFGNPFCYIDLNTAIKIPTVCYDNHVTLTISLRYIEALTSLRLKGSKTCENSCSETSFLILDSAPANFQLKIKEGLPFTLNCSSM